MVRSTFAEDAFSISMRRIETLRKIVASADLGVEDIGEGGRIVSKAMAFLDMMRGHLQWMSSLGKTASEAETVRSHLFVQRHVAQVFLSDAFRFRSGTHLIDLVDGAGFAIKT